MAQEELLEAMNLILRGDAENSIRLCKIAWLRIDFGRKLLDADAVEHLLGESEYLELAESEAPAETLIRYYFFQLEHLVLKLYSAFHKSTVGNSRMNIIDRLKRRFSEWREKHSVVAELEFLADAIARISKLSESLSYHVPASAKDHLERAHKMIARQSRSFRKRNLISAQRFQFRVAVKALHIHLAEHQMRCEEVPALELDLGSSRIESQLLELSRSIVKDQIDR